MLRLASMPRVLRLVPRSSRPRLSILQITARSYAALLTGLLVLITGCLVLTLGIYFFAR